MDKRREVAHVLQRIAFARELLDADTKVAKEFAGAAWTIRQLRGDLVEMRASGELKRTPGVRKAVREVVEHILDGTPVPGLAEMEAKIPEGLFEVRKIPGLGPVKIKALWQQLGITSIGELEYACNENRLTGLKGFGAKTQDAVRAGIAERRLHTGRFRQDQIRVIAASLMAAIRAQAGVSSVAIVGETRRGLETVGSLDFLIAGSENTLDAISEIFAAAAPSKEPATAEEQDEIGQETGLPVITRHASAGSSVSHVIGGAKITATVCSDASVIGAQSILLTGSDAHLDALRTRATEQELTFDERGLVRSNGQVIPCPDEESVYAALGVLSVAPERREAGIALVAAGTSRARLVRRSDLMGALHNHTTASDGVNSLEEMRDSAIAHQLRYLGITDHSKTAFYAKGLEAHALLAQRAVVAKLNDRPEGTQCRILHGVESDILGDGALDYEDSLLAQLDVVIASVHSRLGQKRDEMTARMVTAARNRFTHVVGHPTGRLLLGRPPSDYDVEALLNACVESGCAIELNCNPARLDFNEVHIAMARERGILVSIAADAHSADALSDLEYGVMIARRAGLRPQDVLNCKPLDELQIWLKDRKTPTQSS